MCYRVWGTAPPFYYRFRDKGLGFISIYLLSIYAHFYLVVHSADFKALAMYLSTYMYMHNIYLHIHA